MINFEGAQVIWNISENRPANGDELANLINKGWLLMNFITRANDGKVWIDLADKAEDDFEIRRGLTKHALDGAVCNCKSMSSIIGEHHAEECPLHYPPRQ